MRARSQPSVEALAPSRSLWCVASLCLNRTVPHASSKNNGFGGVGGVGVGGVVGGVVTTTTQTFTPVVAVQPTPVVVVTQPVVVVEQQHSCLFCHGFGRRLLQRASAVV